MSMTKNVRWVFLSQISKIVSQLIIITVLARMLAVESYGLMAIAVSVTNFANLFKDLGSAAAIIQFKDLSDDLKSSIHWSNVLLGGFVGLIIFVFSGAIGTFFGEPELKNILHILALTFPLVSLIIVRQAIFERHSNFNRIAITEFFAAVFSVAISLLLAYLDFGVYSLVFFTVVNTFVLLIGFSWGSNFDPKIIWKFDEIKKIFKFSRNFSGFNFFNYISRNVDNLIIGKFLGASLLGNYSLAMRVMLFPIQNLTFVSNRIIYPSLSRMVQAGDRLDEVYLNSVRLISFFSIPLMMGLFSLRVEFTLVVFGDKWLEVAKLFMFLAPVGILQSIVSSTGALLLAMNKTDTLLKLGFLGMVLQGLSFVIGVQWGLLGVVFCYLIANILNFIPAMSVSLRSINIKFSRFLLILFPCVISSVFMCIVIFIANEFFKFIAIEVATRLLLCVCVGVFVYLIFAKILMKNSFSDIRRFLNL